MVLRSNNFEGSHKSYRHLRRKVYVIVPVLQVTDCRGSTIAPENPHVVGAMLPFFEGGMTPRKESFAASATSITAAQAVESVGT